MLYMHYFVSAVSLCVHVRGAGANFNTVKRIVTLPWNQTNLIHVTIQLNRTPKAEWEKKKKQTKKLKKRRTNKTKSK